MILARRSFIAGLMASAVVPPVLAAVAPLEGYWYLDDPAPIPYRMATPSYARALAASFLRTKEIVSKNILESQFPCA